MTVKSNYFIKILFKNLNSDNSKVEILDIRHNNLSFVSSHELAGAIAKLKEVKLFWNHLTDHHVEQLFEHFSNEKCKLEKLRISENSSKIEETKLASAFAENERCKHMLL